MASSLGAVDGLAPALDHDGAGAVEGGVLVHQSLLQGRGQGDGLEGGAGLIGGVDALVAPLGAHHGAGGLTHRRLVLLLRLVGGTVSLQLCQLLIQLRLERFIVNGAVVVGVVVGVGGHGQNGAGIDIHDDACGTVFRVELIHHALDALFQIVLDVAVQSQNQVLAVLRVIVLFVLVKEVAAHGISGGDRQSGGAGEDGVVLGLQAHAALVFAVDKSDDAGCQCAVRIVALGARLHIDAPDLHGTLGRVLLQDRLSRRRLHGDLVALVVDLAVDETAHLVGYLLVHPLFDDLVLGVGLFHLLQDRLGRHVQDPPKAPGNEFLIPDDGRDIGPAFFLRRLGLLLCCLLLLFQIAEDLIGGDEYGLGRSRQSQGKAVAVVNGAPGRGDHRAAGLLGHRLLLQIIVLADLQVVELPEQHHKRSDAQNRHHQHRSAADHLVCPAGRVTFSL